jgi:hypothetical protein
VLIELKRKEIAAGHASEARGALTSPSERIWFSALLLAAICKLWLLPLRTGFWQDETGTFWAIQGGFAEVIHRTLVWPAQTLLYTLIDWAVVKLGGSSELVMRLPSEVAMLVGAYLLYRLGVRLMSTDAARAATLVFVCSEAVAFAAGDARPYALGTMAVISAGWFLVLWLDRRNFAAGIGFAISASFVIHMHYVLAVSLVVFAVYACYRAWHGERPGTLQILTVLAVFALVTAPIAPHFRSLWQSRQSHSFSGTPGLADFWGILIPPTLIGSLILGFGLANFLVAGFHVRLRRLEPSTLVLVGTWALLPCVLLFGVSSISTVKVFIPRYLLSAAPGLALLAGWLICAVRPPRAQLFALSAFTLATIFSSGGLLHPSHGGDWRAAIDDVRKTAVNPTMPVLVRSGFIESASFDGQSGDPEPQYFHAPLLAYPPSGRIVLLPGRLDQNARAILETAASSLLESSRTFLLVTSGDSVYEYWLLGRLSRAGFKIEHTTVYGGKGSTLRLIAFSKGKPS